MSKNTPFKVCHHRSLNPPPVRDWKECWACADEVAMQLAIARSYLKELAEGVFNEHGDMTGPIAEPLQGRHFQQIAATGLGAASDPEPEETTEV